MNKEDLAVVAAMQRYGGSFVQALAELAVRADPLNLLKIKGTWSDVWVEYAAMAELAAKRE